MAYESRDFLLIVNRDIMFGVFCFLSLSCIYYLKDIMLVGLFCYILDFLPTNFQLKDSKL